MNPGDAVGPYLIHGPLGSGGMGEVYRARDTRLGREVALKRLSDAALPTDVARRRVLREAQAAAALLHPNIAAIFDVLETAEGAVIVMEYVRGEPLTALIARGPVPVDQALEIGSQIAAGLAEAHARGVVHRDLKPANVHITPEGTAKILDFGIARSGVGTMDGALAGPRDSRTEAGRLVGTPGYMAPEQLAGGSADQRTDVYALGLLLFEMVSGRRPFDNADLVGNAMAVLGGRAPRLGDVAPQVPPDVSAVVERALERDPDNRFATAADLLSALRHARRGISEAPTRLAETATVAPVPVTRRRRISRGRALALVLAAAGILAAGLASLHWREDGAVPPATSPPPVVAVLPVQNDTSDEANDPIAVGLTEAVATRLSIGGAVRVVSADEAREVARATSDAAGAARALGAAFAVEGALRRTGRVLDVELALVSGDGRRRAAGRYSGDDTEPFELHRLAAEGVANALSEAGAIRKAGGFLLPLPTGNREAFAEYTQGRVFLERPDVPGHLDHAIRLFQSAIQKDRRFALAHAALGEAYWAQYRETNDPRWPNRATASIIDALRIDPDRVQVRLSLAVMYHGLGRLDDAEKEVRHVIEKQPDNDDAHRLLAAIRIDRGQWNEATESLRHAIALRPNYWRNHSELGYAHYRAGRLTEAAAAYERVVQLQPDSARGYHMLGTVHQSAGRGAPALENYAKANAIRPSASTLSNMGTIHYWAGQYARAADAYERAVRLAPNQPDLYANLGDALLKQGGQSFRNRALRNYRKAIEEVEKLLAVNENDALNLSLLALYRAKLGDHAAASRAIEKAVALSPHDGEVLFARAAVEALAGRTSQACAALAEALSRGASREVVRRADELRALKGCPAYDQLAGG